MLPNSPPILLAAFFLGLACAECHAQYSDALKPPSTDTNVIATPASHPSPPSLVLTPEDVTPSDTVKVLEGILEVDNGGHADEALKEVNTFIEAHPKDIAALSLRGHILGEKKDWAGSKKDYETILQIDDKSTVAKYDLCNLDFLRKDYDAARPGFVALETDSEYGDLAAYKVFLCDLLAGHEDAAKSELGAFQEVGSNPSFYFASVAWNVHLKQFDEAWSYLNSATRIYNRRKFMLYAASLQIIGYLPLPEPIGG